MGFVPRFSLTLALAAGALMLSPNGLRADQVTQVRGTIVDAHGNPMVGAEVRLRRGAGDEVRSVADERGHFALAGLYTGQVKLRVRAGWYRECFSTLSLDSGGDVLANVRLVDEYPIARVSAHMFDPVPCRVAISRVEAFDRYVIR